jgi:ketosteroid isomerase-like protein
MGFWPTTPPPSKGIEAYKKTWDLFFSWSRYPIVFDFSTMNITVGSDVAFCPDALKGGEPN